MWQSPMASPLWIHHQVLTAVSSFVTLIDTIPFFFLLLSRILPPNNLAYCSFPVFPAIRQLPVASTHCFFDRGGIEPIPCLFSHNPSLASWTHLCLPCAQGRLNILSRSTRHPIIHHPVDDLSISPSTFVIALPITSTVLHSPVKQHGQSIGTSINPVLLPILYHYLTLSYFGFSLANIRR